MILMMVIMVPVVVVLALQVAEVIDTHDGHNSDCDDEVGITVLMMMIRRRRMPGVIVKMVTVAVARAGKKLQCGEERIFWLHCT